MIRAAVERMKRSAAWSSFWSDEEMEILARAALNFPTHALWKGQR